MIVIGGTYFERCVFPDWDTLFGSGLRGAAQISKFESVEFHTFASPYVQRRLPSLADEMNIDIRSVSNPYTYVFDYLYSMGKPTPDSFQDSLVQRLENIDVRCDRALIYGTLEEYQDVTVKVDAEFVVYDPQSNPTPFSLKGCKARHLAIVLNAAEARQWGNSALLEDCAKRICDVEGASVVVVKRGPYGATVYDRSKGIFPIPAYKTDRFFKIGSGDIFSAVFAHLWTQGKSSEEAAKRASLATAHYVESKQLVGSLENMALLEQLPLEQRPWSVYLAGPFFTVADRWLVNDVREVFDSLDVDIVSPIHDIGVGPDDEVAKKDLSRIEECDAVFAILNGADPGTMFEVGYARKISKPVIAFYQNMRGSDLTMLSGSGCILENDLSMAIYRTVWAGM